MTTKLTTGNCIKSTRMFSKINFHLLIFVFVFLFTAIFSNFIKINLGPLFAKDLYAYDESANSVAGANVYRKFFPAQLRLNPLVDDYGLNDWIEAKYWMHIPPLFAYVPYPLYVLDGGVSIEIKRLSYALVTFLTGIIFIIIAKVFFKQFKYILSSFIAACLLLFTPFTKGLIIGFQFGLSDIVLAFATVIAFVGVAYYFIILRQQSKTRLWPYALIGAACALPFCVKSMLGLIPMATVAVMILFDRKGLKKLMYFILGFILIAGAFYIPLCIESPKIFLYEFMTSFKHFDNYEGWQRPWNIFFSDYLPNNYLVNPRNMYLFFGLYALGFISVFLVKEKPQRNLLIVSGIWLIWNLAVVTIVKSKAPNFIYSTYIFGLFFIVANIFIILDYVFSGAQIIFKRFNLRILNAVNLLVIFGAGVYATYCVYRTAVAFADRRANNIQISESAKFYDLAVRGRELGWGSDDLVIIDAPNAYWLRFHVMFVSGSEGVSVAQMAGLVAGNASARSVVMSKYKRVHFIKLSDVCSNNPFFASPDSIWHYNGYTIYSYNSQKLSYLYPREQLLCD